MYSEKISQIVRTCPSIESALKKMIVEFGKGKLKHLFWAFSVHSHALIRNDVLICETFENADLLAAFLASGGAANDVVANKIHSIDGPFEIDIVRLAEMQRDNRDTRLAFTETLLANDLKTAWICVVDEPWTGGIGVFNQFYSERNAEPEIAQSEVSEIAHIFHDKIRRERLIAKEVDLRASQIEFLSEVVKGRSAEDLAAKYEISSRAVEKRLEKIRFKLKSRNTLEAVYKATMYGVLPYSKNV